MVSLEVQPLRSSFGKVFMGAAGTSTGPPVDDEFNLVSFMSHFEGANNGVNNAFDDGSANNHTITAAGNVSQGSFGPFARPDGEWSVDFDGSGDSLTTPENAATRIAQSNFTFEAFIFPTGGDSNEDTIFTQGADGVYSPFNVFVKSNKITLYISTNGTSWNIAQDQSSSNSVAINSWTHVALVRNGATIQLYINGVADNSYNVGTNTFFTPTQVTSVGSRPAGDRPFTGYISNVRLVIGTAVYTSAFTPPTSLLTAITNTKLLTCQSNRFVDNSATGLAVSRTGNPAVTAFGPFLTSAVYDAAVNGASAHFDGSGDALSTSSMTVNGTGNFTLELWAYMTSTTGNRTFAVFNDTSNANNILQYYVRNGEFKLYSNDGGVRTFSGGSAPRNQWAWLHLSRSGSTATLKVNNVSYGTVSSSETTNGVLGIGGYVNQSIGNPYEGYMCDYRVSNTIRSSAIPTQPLGTDSNTKLLLNMADGQAIDNTAQRNLSLENGTNISTAQAKFGNSSLYFDGSTDTATVIGSENVNFGTANFTVEGWIRPASFSGYKPNIISKWTNGSRGWAVRLVASGSGFVMRFTFSTNGSNDSSLDATTVLAFDTWHHFAFVQSSNTVTCYANGTANGTISCSTIFASTNPIILGDWDSNQGDYNGYIDDIRVTTGVARYTSNFTAPAEAFPDKGR